MTLTYLSVAREQLIPKTENCALGKILISFKLLLRNKIVQR
jgi:hypothetical protein